MSIENKVIYFRANWLAKYSMDVTIGKLMQEFPETKFHLVDIDLIEKRDLLDQYKIEVVPTIIIINSHLQTKIEGHSLIKPLRKLLREINPITK